MEEQHAHGDVHSVIEHLHTAVVHAEALLHGGHGATPAAVAPHGWDAVKYYGAHTARVGIPFLGACFVSYLVGKDAQHAMKELNKKRRSLCVFFLWLIAAGCGAIDASAHILHVLSMTLLHIDHHLVEDMEWYGAACAVMATLSAVLAEVLSHKAAHSVNDQHPHGGLVTGADITTRPTEANTKSDPNTKSSAGNVAQISKAQDSSSDGVVSASTSKMFSLLSACLYGHRDKGGKAD